MLAKNSIVKIFLGRLLRRPRIVVEPVYSSSNSSIRTACRLSTAVAQSVKTATNPIPRVAKTQPRDADTRSVEAARPWFDPSIGS